MYCTVLLYMYVVFDKASVISFSVHFSLSLSLSLSPLSLLHS